MNITKIDCIFISLAIVLIDKHRKEIVQKKVADKKLSIFQYLKKNYLKLFQLVLKKAYCKTC